MNRFKKDENIKLLSTMTRWASIENNAMFVFQKTYEQNINSVYSEFIENFVLRVNRGMDASLAIEKDLKKIESPFMRNVFINLQSVIENNGDLFKLLSKFEHEAFKIEETLFNNSIKNYKDRMLLLIMIIITAMSLFRVYYMGLLNQMIFIAASAVISISIIVFFYVGRYQY